MDSFACDSKRYYTRIACNIFTCTVHTCKIKLQVTRESGRDLLLICFACVCARARSDCGARISVCVCVRAMAMSEHNIRRQSGQFAFVVIVNRLDKCVRFIEIKSNFVHTRKCERGRAKQKMAKKENCVALAGRYRPNYTHINSSGSNKWNH